MLFEYVFVPGTGGVREEEVNDARAELYDTHVIAFPAVLLVCSWQFLQVLSDSVHRKGQPVNSISASQ